MLQLLVRLSGPDENILESRNKGLGEPSWWVTILFGNVWNDEQAILWTWLPVISIYRVPERLSGLPLTNALHDH